MTNSMTEGKVWKLILLFTLPIMAGNFLQQLYNTVDSIIVGNFAANGESALAAVGTCTPVTFLFIAIAMGMSSGASILVAQYFGARQLEDMRRAVSTSLILLTGIGLVFSIVGGIISRWVLLHLLNVQDYLLADATAYFSIYCFGLVFQFIYNIVSSILRALGDSKATLYFLLVSSLTNIVLDLLFVAVFHWDVPGVAIATVIAQALSAVVSVVYMFKKYPALRFARGEFRFHGDMGLLALKLGIPTTLQQCVISFGHIAIQRLVNTFDITAAYTAGMRTESFVLIPIFGFNVGLATFTGQNIGAQKPERVKQGLRDTMLMSGVSCAVLSVFTYLAAPLLLGLFNLSGENMAYGLEYLHFTAPAYLVFCLYITINGVLQGAGDVVFTAVNTLTSLLIRCVAAYLLAFLTPVGYAAAWVSLPVGWLYSLVLSGVRYRMGGWRNKSVVKAGKQEG